MFPVPARKKWHCLPGRVRYTKAQPVVTDVHVRSLVSNTVVPIPGAWWYGYSLLFFFSSLAWGLIFVVVNFSLAAGPCYKNIIQDVGVSSLNLPLKKKKGINAIPMLLFVDFL